MLKEVLDITIIITFNLKGGIICFSGEDGWLKEVFDMKGERESNIYPFKLKVGKIMKPDV